MIHDPYIVPPLPTPWPYEPGRPLRPLGCRVNLDLPGLGSGWRVCTPGGQLITGEAVRKVASQVERRKPVPLSRDEQAEDRRVLRAIRIREE